MAQFEYNFSPEELSTSYKKYRKELWQVMYLAMEPVLKHMSTMSGIRYKEILPDISGNFQLGNYKEDRKGNGNFDINGRTFQTFHGNLVEPINPNKMLATIWGADEVRPDQLNGTPIVKILWSMIMKSVGENNALNMWTAKHDAAQKNGVEHLFDGFCTIIDKDIAGTNEEGKVKISADLGNLKTIETITKENAEDVLKDFFWSLDKKLRGQQTKLFMSDMAYHYYTEAYQVNHGSLPYNQAYDKRTLEGASNVEIVPLFNVPDDFLLLTPKNNIFMLFNNRGSEEKAIIKPSLTSHYQLDVIMDMFLGTQFRSVDKSVFAVGKTA